MIEDDRHISSGFDHDLSKLQNLLASMCGEVESQVRDTQSLLVNGDTDMIEKVLSKAPSVNKLEINIDKKCITMLAQRSPIANDLRWVVSASKVVSDVERIGDEAERIAKEVESIVRLGMKIKPPQGILEIVNAVKDSVSMSMDAYLRVDIDTAYEVIEGDKNIDKIYTQVLEILAQDMLDAEKKKHIGADVSWLWVARSLERMGDHCCNIAEYIVYLDKGEDIRHS